MTFQVHFLHTNAGAEFDRTFRANSKTQAHWVAAEWLSNWQGASRAPHCIGKITRVRGR